MFSVICFQYINSNYPIAISKIRNPLPFSKIVTKKRSHIAISANVSWKINFNR